MIPLKDTHTSGGIPFWTLVFIAINIYAFYLQVTVPDPEGFVAQYALIPSLVDFNNWNTLLPFITSQFLHAGLLHIGSNMLFLWIFGDNVEKKLGFILFPIFYLLCGVIAGLSQYILSPGSEIPMLGASGAIAGVLGAYFVYFPHHTVKTLIPIFGFFTIMEVPASVMLFYWIFTQVISGLVSIGPTISSETGGVAFFAHIGGFVAGWVLAKMLQGKPLATIET